jgi:dethiobiotin synthetase
VALTCEALAHRGLRCAGVVVGAWPSEPDLASRCNLDDLAAYARAPLLGALPENAGVLSRSAFLAAAKQGLAGAAGVIGRSAQNDLPQEAVA